MKIMADEAPDLNIGLLPGQGTEQRVTLARDLQDVLLATALAASRTCIQQDSSLAFPTERQAFCKGKKGCCCYYTWEHAEFVGHKTLHSNVPTERQVHSARGRKGVVVTPGSRRKLKWARASEGITFFPCGSSLMSVSTPVVRTQADRSPSLRLMT